VNRQSTLVVVAVLVIVAVVAIVAVTAGAFFILSPTSVWLFSRSRLCAAAANTAPEASRARASASSAEGLSGCRFSASRASASARLP
jgi:hypothetical protein